MRLRLERPIVFIDIQSTGLDPKTARIVRLSTLKIDPDGAHANRQELIDPEAPIPPGATAVHGISDDDIAGRPPFRSFAGALAGYLDGCDLAGFAIERFALPLLRAEFARAGHEVSFEGAAVIDAMTLFHRREPRDFAAAYRRFVGGEPPDDMGGAEAAFRVLEGELDQYADLPDDVEGLETYIHPANPDAVDPDSRLVRGSNGDVLFNFGRHRGERLLRVAEEAPDYLEWVAGNDEFSAAVRETVGAVLRGELLPVQDEGDPAVAPD
ncbi:MAG: 3'-5' exonuclease [Chloroflexi bacterium]|nr:3'-5' exonuclease [Chloroflexota bacterium]